METKELLELVKKNNDVLDLTSKVAVRPNNNVIVEITNLFVRDNVLYAGGIMERGIIVEPFEQKYDIVSETVKKDILNRI